MRPGRTLVLLGVAVVVAAVVAALVLVRSDDEGRSVTDPGTAPSASSAPEGSGPPVGPTVDPDAPVDLTFTPQAEATRARMEECLARPEVVVLGPDDATTRLGRGANPPIADRSTIDARAVEWVVDRGDLPPSNPVPESWGPGTSGFRYPVDVRAQDDQPRGELCLVGGRVTSPYPDQAGDRRDELGWDVLWHHTTGIGFSTAAATVVGAELERQGDGINFQGTVADGWVVVGVRMREVHDDCVEADEHTSGRIVDSFFDGCYSFLASRSPSIEGDPDTTIQISGSLIRMQAMLAAYEPDRNGRPSHAHVFKWEDDAPGVEVVDTVVRADRLPHGRQQFAVPSRLTCRDATFVWGGSEPLPEQTEGFMRCFDDDGVEPLGERITTDTAVWDDAVAAWEAARPA